MAALKLNQIRELIKAAYAAGYNGPMDLCEQYADDALALVTEKVRENRSAPGTSGDWRVFTAEELKKQDFGTVFEHSRLGKCWIDGTSSNKYMTFENGEQSFFVQNIEPWDEPMKIAGRL